MAARGCSPVNGSPRGIVEWVLAHGASRSGQPRPTGVSRSRRAPLLQSDRSPRSQHSRAARCFWRERRRPPAERSGTCLSPQPPRGTPALLAVCVPPPAFVVAFLMPSCWLGRRGAKLAAVTPTAPSLACAKRLANMTRRTRGWTRGKDRGTWFRGTWPRWISMFWAWAWNIALDAPLPCR